MLGGGDIGECASGEVWDSSIRKGDSTAFVVGACGCAGCSAEVCSYRNGGSAALIVGVGGCAGCLVEVWGFGKGGSAALVVCVGGCARYCWFPHSVLIDQERFLAVRFLWTWPSIG